jgi:hypothetical protein
LNISVEFNNPSFFNSPNNGYKPEKEAEKGEPENG